MRRLEVGDRIKFAEERAGYTVQAVSASGRWAACTRPFPLRRTVIYTLLDTVNMLRGVDNSIGNSLGYETRQDCEEVVAQFERGEFEYSHRMGPIKMVVAWHRKSLEGK